MHVRMPWNGVATTQEASPMFEIPLDMYGDSAHVLDVDQVVGLGGSIHSVVPDGLARVFL